MVNLKRIFLSLLGLGVLISCGTEPTPTYQLTTSVVGNGSVNPSSGQFDEGELVNITSTPDSGWVFSNWEGDWTSSQTPATITMDGDKTIIGVFERKDYPLNITIIGEGSVSERVLLQPKVTDYPFETVVELTPVPANEWWSFSSWGGDIVSEQNIILIKINDKTNVSSRFSFLGRIYISSYVYDTNNNIIERIDLKTDGTLLTKENYSYDSNNYRIEQIATDSDGLIKYRYSWDYDSYGNKVEELRYDSENKLRLTLSYEYDSKNNRILSQVFNSSGELDRYSKYHYDNKNNVIELLDYESDSTLAHRTTYIYDSNNNEIETSSYNLDLNTPYRVTTRDYDFNNNPITIRTKYTNLADGKNSVRSYNYTYDSMNNILERIRYDDEKFIRRDSYNYDEIGNLTKWEDYDSFNNISTKVVYKYNSNSNLIDQKRYEYQKGKIVSNQTDNDPLNELCNQLNLPEQQMISIFCED